MIIAEEDTIVMLGIAKDHNQRYALVVLFLLAAMVLNSPFLASPGHAQLVSGPATVAYCGDVLVASDTTLSQNVMTVNGGNCVTNGLIVGANNILLNCAGHSITGQSPYVGSPIGIDLNGYTGVTIENCNVNLFVYGIAANPSNNDTFAGNTVDNNGGGGGFYFGGSSYNDTFIGNTANNNTGAGFYFGGSSHNETFTGNTANNNTLAGFYFGSASSSYNDTFTGNTSDSNGGGGFYLAGSSNNTLIGNAADNNSYGLYLLSSSNNTLSGNTADNNTYWGFVVEDSLNNTFTQNTANNNAIYGFYILSSSPLPPSNNAFTGNTADNNTYTGFYIFNSSHDTFTGNTADSSPTASAVTGSGAGFSLISSPYNTLSGNRAESNSFAGFVLYYSPNSTFIQNTANNNTSVGFYSVGSSNFGSYNILTGNTANYNALYGFSDSTSGSGTLGTGNTYTNDICIGNTLAGSIPTGLCSATLTDFTITASPSTIYVNAGSAGTSTIVIAAVNGFSGIVSLSADNTACSVSPTSVTGSGSATLTCTFASAQIPTVTVTGTSGSLSHTASIMFNVASTTSGGCGTGCTVTVSSDATVTNFTSDSTQIGFTASGQSGTTAFANATIPKSAVPNISLLQATINGTLVTPTITSDSTNYYVYVTFTFHSVFAIHIFLVPQDFTIAAAQTILTVNPGTSATTAITVAPVNDFTGTVAMTTTVSPTSGLVCSVSPTSIAGGSGISTLTCNGTGGTYTVTVTGTSGSTTHTVTVTVIVTQVTTLPAPFFTQSTWEHRFSLSKYNDVQVWTFGVKSNSTGPIYFAVTISATDGSGAPFTLTTPVMSVSHFHNIQGITLSQTFNQSELGDTYTFNMVIHWGTTATTEASQLPFTSTLTNGAPTSGSFTVLA